ncbi:MAG: ATP-binding cassette domain-containing protein [Candidatus Hodgkinia cicadicola]
MGNNGVGKSTLALALIADAKVTVEGSGHCCGLPWSGRTALETARSGVFLSFQNPVEMPGVLYCHFLKLIADRTNTGASLVTKLSLVNSLLKVRPSLLKRGVNTSFSGGERKLFELIQMLIMEPRLCILDEPDSGLDFSKIELVSNLVLSFGGTRRSLLVITHSRKLVASLKPDNIYLLTGSTLVRR